ncbi:SPOR domain-containing protein [Glaciimonas sp. GG7]
MGLLSLFSKKKPQPNAEQSAYQSRSTEDTSRIRASRKDKNSGKKSNDAIDPVLPEKKRARRRLVGAIALVLAVVIILPMVLDSEPKPLSNDIAIQIPSRDKPASTSEAALAAVPAAASATVSSASGVASAGDSLDQQEEIIDPASTAAVPTKQQPSVTNLAGSRSAASAIPAPAPQIMADNKTEPNSIVKPESKPKVKDDRKSIPPPKANIRANKLDDNDVSPVADDSARAAAILNGHNNVPSPSSAEKKSAKFIIQVAALASQEKVDELQGKLSSAGIHSYTQKIKTSSGERIRIRIGPFASKEEAEKARTKLAPLGLSGALIPT